MASDNSNILVDEKLAISLFLDSLLCETEVEHEVQSENSLPETSTDTELDQEQLKVVPEIKTEVEILEIPAEIKPEFKILDKVDSAIKEDVQVANQIIQDTKEIPLAPIVPEWAQEPFQILLFKVAGLQLAVPLLELSGVIEWTDSVTEMPGHADFYMGILQHLNYKIPVIDTARMVLPTKKLEQLVDDDPRKRVKHIVLIDDYGWGLACDKIGEVITLNPDDVRWRTSNSSRNWLAGTVIEHMCALLNSDGFSAMIEKGHKTTD